MEAKVALDHHKEDEVEQESHLLQQADALLSYSQADRRDARDSAKKDERDRDERIESDPGRSRP